NGANDDAVTTTTTTAAGTGDYSFANLGPGRYFVQEVVPAFSAQTAPGAPGFYTVVASSGTNASGRDFGNTGSLLAVGMGQSPSGDSQVRVLDAHTGTQQFLLTPYGNYAGEVRVAVGDVTGDGVPDIITGAGSAGADSHVKVFDGQSGTEI